MISQITLAALVWGSVLLVAALFGYELLALVSNRRD